MSPRKATVEMYFEGVRRSDHARILALLTEDVVWDLAGHAHLEGKAALDREIENEQFTGSPKLTVDRLVEEGDTMFAIGGGESRHVSCRPTGSPSRARRSAASSRTSSPSTAPAESDLAAAR